MTQRNAVLSALTGLDFAGVVTTALKGLVVDVVAVDPDIIPMLDPTLPWEILTNRDCGSPPAGRVLIALLRARSAALHMALAARTTAEFGAALEQLRTGAAVSIKQLVKRTRKTRVWIAQSTVSRVCNGHSLFRDADYVVSFVTACGRPEEAEQWVEAWEAVRAHRPTRAVPRELVHDDAAQPVTAATSGEAPADGLATEVNQGDAPAESAGTADDVLTELTVQVTRRHLRMAIAVLAGAGLDATDGSAPTVNSAGATAIAMAGALALLEREALTLTSQRTAGDS